jgi:hypothetical protein
MKVELNEPNEHRQSHPIMLLLACDCGSGGRQRLAIRIGPNGVRPAIRNSLITSLRNTRMQTSTQLYPKSWCTRTQTTMQDPWSEVGLTHPLATSSIRRSQA